MSKAFGLVGKVVASAVQPKMAGTRQPNATVQQHRAPVAPPVYRPQPAPRVLQPKTANNQQSQAVKSPGQPPAPPVYRPQTAHAFEQHSAQMKNSAGSRVTGVQPKTAASAPCRSSVPCGCGCRTHASASGPSNTLIQPRMAERPAAVARTSPVALATGSIQMAKKNGKMRAGMQSNTKTKIKTKKAESKVDKTWRNLQCYTPNKAEQVLGDYPNTYKDVIKDFIKYHKPGIRGHCSTTSGNAQNAQTTQDLQTFNSWYNTNKAK